MAGVVHLPHPCMGKRRIFGAVAGCRVGQVAAGECWGMPGEAQCAVHCVCWQGCLLLWPAYLKSLCLNSQAVLASMCCWTAQLYPSLKTNVKAPAQPLGRDSSLGNRSMRSEGGSSGGHMHPQDVPFASAPQNPGVLAGGAGKRELSVDAGRGCCCLHGSHCQSIN